MFALKGNGMKPFFDPVGLVVSRVEGVATLPTLAAFPTLP